VTRLLSRFTFGLTRRERWETIRRMVFESPHIRVSVEYGTATLWLAFPGEPVNALDVGRLRELDAALQAVSATHAIRVLVVRSSLPAGFCAGIHPNAIASLTNPADRAAFAWFGQRVLERLAQLDCVTLAFIDGPCLGVGLELALACDYRLCVARPTTHLGFPDRFACWGGTARLRQLLGRRCADFVSSGRTLSGREARDLGIVDVACCERRAKIELRTFLDRLEMKPVKPREARELTGLAGERRTFAEATLPAIADLRVSPPTVQPLSVVGLLGDDPDAARIVAEVVLRGASGVVCGSRAAVFAAIETSLTRGFVTPLEAEQGRLRVRASDTLDGFDRAALIFVAQGCDPFRLAAVVRTRAVVCAISPGDVGMPVRPETPFPFPRRLVRIGFHDTNRVALFPGLATDPNTLTTVAAWLKPFGLTATVFPTAARLLRWAA